MCTRSCTSICIIASSPLSDNIFFPVKGVCVTHTFLLAGKGAMAEVSTIVSAVNQYLQKPDELSQKT